MKIFIDNERNSSRRERQALRGRLFARSGFTLIELLTVIAIIGMLGAISVTTVRAAIESARTTQTRTTIAKIDSVLTSIYEKYQYRRVDVTDYGLGQNADAVSRAFARLCVMRDLLRRDMPCNELEVRTKSQFSNGSNAYTPLQESYLFVLESAKDPGDEERRAEREDLNPELLYLVLTNAAPECRSTFSDRELADTDGDGLLEFVDGWGKPIRWLRWAPCLRLSDRQPTLRRDGDGVIILPPLPPVVDDDSDYFAEMYEDRSNSDPFDPLAVLLWRKTNVTDANMRPGWFLVPYVYSAGPDGSYGVCDVGSEDVALMNDPFSALDESSDFWLGDPVEVDGVRTYKDNIDNHTLIR